MGTDDRGRDVLSRIVAGGKFSISLGIFTTAIALLIGIVFGFLSGYYGGWIDSFVGFLVNITLAFPSLLLAIALSSVMEPGYRSIFITLVAVGWAGFAKLIRGETLKLKKQPSCAGRQSTWRIGFIYYDKTYYAFVRGNNYYRGYVACRRSYSYGKFA